MNGNQAVIDVHILQTIPPSCLNRDGTNAPKTAVYGGARRARVSSQAWKRATRRYFNEHLDALTQGVRTRKLSDHLVKELKSRLGDRAVGQTERLERLVNDASTALVTTKKQDNQKSSSEQDKDKSVKVTLFISRRAIDATLDQLVDAFDGGTLDATALREAMGRAHSLDIALFGRMIASVPDLQVDAACQVAHALSTHRVTSEFDYFTAVDDLVKDDEQGAAMIGNVEFNSATLYRYASVGLGQLAENLGQTEPVAAGVRAFIDGFTKSLPTGHQSTFAAMTLPDLVFVALRADQPVSLVGAFEKPVKGTDGYVVESARRLAERAEVIDQLYGVQRVQGWASYLPHLQEVVAGSLGTSISFPTLLNAVETAVGSILDVGS